ncbi:hypothetical protein QN277_023510 [Acacia crassicarpa]|uniref:Reverse transcriptase domain-containing protein n=1 Tax=Acacia crassicarpa TaxID=499986 RepID=A0AAE1JLG4_9FABA|nr:hypothetical protein QN277_023510 [Acacia crassicarpa]
MNFILWNVRGAGARSFPLFMRGMVQTFGIDFVAIFETRCSGTKAKRIAASLGFPNYKIVDASGFRGGIWCLWSEKFLQVEVLECSNQYIHVRITNHVLQVWEMTFVYGSPNISQRRALWRELKQLNPSVRGPWCLGGDFNATLESNERHSQAANRGPDKEFCKFVEDAALNDLGFIGPPFTWQRTGVETRLDRVLGTTTWQEAFPNAVVKHLNWYKSDHRPLLLQVDGGLPKLQVNRPFRFLAAWVLDERFSPFVSENWQKDLPWTENILQFTAACSKWNGQVFGFTNARKRKLLRRLNGITRTEARFGLTLKLEELQRSLWKELDEVLVQESLIWAQKSRSQWTVDGDRNTRYFHSRANGRRKRNFIGALKGNDDVWIYDGDQIKNMTVSFFSSLFREEQERRPLLSCTVTYPGIDPEELNSLARHITEAEIKAALFSMGALKAPGPDGLNALFYQSQWQVVEKSICEFVKSLWFSPSQIQSINDTLIVLIPKKDHPEVVQDFRPISLCNVIFKIVTKVIANRIKVVLPKIISPHQCSFVPGRHSSDNIIVAQEVIHSMRNLQGKRGYMAIKIDLEKANDRVNWLFLRDCLGVLNLPSSFIDVILSCVSTPTMQLLWNGERAGSFTPTRGVRQGDPLSPYLFVICMERLAHLIQESIGKGAWRPIKLCRNGPPLSHLFFADDIVLFVEASVFQAEEVKNCLDTFCMASGLKVNASKTRVFFSKNVNHLRRTELCEILGFQVTPDLGKYLGVPLHHERVTTRTYQVLVDKVRKRLSSWNITSLSLAGRSVLASSVTAAIPGYTMQTASLPITTCDDIEKQNRSFLWGSAPEKRKPHHVSWDTVCEPKKHRGLGLKHLHRQNQAYMMKLGWNLIKHRNDLWVRVVRSKYRCGDDLMPNIEPRRIGSNAWSGIKKIWAQVTAGTTLDPTSGCVQWKYDRHGEFTVRSAYQALSEVPLVEDRTWHRI